MFSRKDITKILVPLFIQQILSVLIGMVDSMMVSSAGDAAVSGVSLVSSLDLVLIYAFLALATGGSVVASIALGKGDKERACAIAKQLIYAVTCVAILISAVVLVFRKLILGSLFGDVEADVMKSAEDYFFYIVLSFPVLGLYDSIAALFRAMGNSAISLKTSLIINGVNIVGNAILIYGFQMGAAGAAISTLIARVIGAGIMLVLIHSKKNPIYITKIFKYRPDGKIIGSILRIGIPSGIENCMFQFGKLMTQSLISSLGTVSIAANAVANSLATLQYVPGSAVNTATVAIVGRCIGAGEEKQAKRYSRMLLAIAYCTLWLVVLSMVLFAKPIISLYGIGAESAQLAKKLVLYHGACAVILWPIAFCMPHIFRSAGDVKFSLYISAFSMWAFRVALGYVFTLESVSLFTKMLPNASIVIPGLGLGVMGVWIAMTVDWVFRAVLFLIHYLRGNWMRAHTGKKKKSKAAEKV